MTRYVHIVQVHPVENGEVNLAKVKAEFELDTKNDADLIIEVYNSYPRHFDRHGTPLQAVYLGRVNDSTGELE